MTKEVVIPATYDGKSLARLSRLKWLVAALLAVALLLGWMARKPVKTTEVTDTIDFSAAAGKDGPTARGSATPGGTAPPVPGSAKAPLVPSKPAASAQAPAAPATATRAAPAGPRLELERRVDGRIAVRGFAADAAARDQWLNAIRIGAQGSRVDAELELLETPVGAAAPWEARLRQLTALAADRRLSRITLAGNRLELEGPAVATSYRQDTERMFLAQLPEGFDIQYRIVNPSTGGKRGAAAAKGVVAPEQAAAASAPSAAPTAAPVREARPVPADNAPRAPAGCPAQLDRLTDSIFFRTDSVGIGREDRDRLVNLGRCLGRQQLSVVGFADGRHTSKYNLELSMRRAQAVADLIRTEAPRGAVIRVSAEGAERGKTRADAERSRRVEIRLR